MFRQLPLGRRTPCAPPRWLVLALTVPAEQVPARRQLNASHRDLGGSLFPEKDNEDAEAHVPVSVRNSQLVYEALKACGVKLVSALPETWLVHLIRIAEDDPEMIVVQLAREEEGVGISAGAHLAGVRSAMLLQNHGLLASVNGIVSLARLYRIPLLMLISYRGEFGERDPWQTEGGGVTEPLLRALDTPYERLDEPSRLTDRIRKAQALAESSLKPVALLLGRDLMWED